MKDESTPEAGRELLGIAHVYPYAATVCLVRAAEAAKLFRPGDVRRLKIIDDAISKVRHEFPNCFRRQANGNG